MIFEYQSQEARQDARAEAVNRLQSARQTEKELLASGKIRPRRVNGYTIVVCTDQNTPKYQ